MILTELQKFQVHVLVDLKVPSLERIPPDILADVTDIVTARQYGYRGLIMASFVTVTA